jgi:hypothetical protein
MRFHQTLPNFTQQTRHNIPENSLLQYNENIKFYGKVKVQILTETQSLVAGAKICWQISTTLLVDINFMHQVKCTKTHVDELDKPLHSLNKHFIWKNTTWQNTWSASLPPQLSIMGYATTNIFGSRTSFAIAFTEIHVFRGNPFQPTA